MLIYFDTIRNNMSTKLATKTSKKKVTIEEPQPETPEMKTETKTETKRNIRGRPPEPNEVRINKAVTRVTRATSEAEKDRRKLSYLQKRALPKAKQRLTAVEEQIVAISSRVAQRVEVVDKSNDDELDHIPSREFNEDAEDNEDEIEITEDIADEQPDELEYEADNH